MNEFFRDAPVLTQDQEHEYIRLWQENQDRDALGSVVHSRGRWVWTVLKQLSLPPWIDMDSVHADVLSGMTKALTSYDNKRGLTAYLYPVVARIAYKSAGKQNKQYADYDFNYIIDEAPGEAGDVLEAIEAIIDETPPEELNDTAKILIRRVITGHGVAQIANLMGWTPERTKRNVEHVRGYIAHKMLEREQSAAPWIDDKDLVAMANVYRQAIANVL